MKREDIIAMAREAGAVIGSPAPGAPEVIFTQCLDVERLAALAYAAGAAAERDECACLCDALERTKVYGAKECAEGIRARGRA